MPASQFWPSVYENRLFYLQALESENFTYLSAVFLYNSSLKHTLTYDTESRYLATKARILCYSIEQEADDETHASLILATWAEHCDRTIMFYTSPRLLDKLMPSTKSSERIDLVYVDPSNSTIGALLAVLQKHLTTYSWFIYVPSKVFLLPDNLKYHLAASTIDPQTVAFLGKPKIDRLFGTWRVSDTSPLAMSARAISVATSTPSCNYDSIQGEQGMSLYV